METIFRYLSKYVPIPPFLLSSAFYDHLAEPPPKKHYVFPPPTWTFARNAKDGTPMPQTIAHRGYKAEHPENTMGAFRGAVEVGANAIEMDIHLSKDGEVVISHDATLKRCFGKDDQIATCEWDYLSTLRTLKAPHEPMPRLRDVLEYLATPGLEDIWLLLDIKLDNENGDTVMRLIASVIGSVSPSPLKPWNSRVVLGIWAAKYLSYCTIHLPDFPITFIGFSPSYAEQFLSVPQVSFNMFQRTFCVSSRFIRKAHAQQRPVYVWTVDDDAMMTWSINAGVDGVITDDPRRFLAVCREWQAGERSVRMGWRAWAMTLWFYFMVLLFGAIMRWRHRGVMGRRLNDEKLLKKA